MTYSLIVIDDINDYTTVSDALARTSTLLAFFELNERDQSARQYTYAEIPAHYVFKQCNENRHKVYKWFKWKPHSNCIGHIYSVSPSKIELFHLRLLLFHRKGVNSFNDLKKVNNVQYSTFSDTCLALGLIEDDEEWSRAM